MAHRRKEAFDAIERALQNMVTPVTLWIQRGAPLQQIRLPAVSASMVGEEVETASKTHDDRALEVSIIAMVRPTDAVDVEDLAIEIENAMQSVTFGTGLHLRSTSPIANEEGERLMHTRELTYELIYPTGDHPEFADDFGDRR